VLPDRIDRFLPELAGASQVGPAPDWRAQPQSGFVVSVDDPNGRGRVQVDLVGLDPAGETRVWARVATGFAGDNYGMFALPGVGEEVMVVFLGGDPAHPVVVGALWNGSTALPEDQPAGESRVWGLAGRAGSRMAIDESQDGSARLVMETPGGVKVELQDAGDRIELSNGSMTIRMEGEHIQIESGARVTITASTVTIDAPQMRCSAALATFDGVINCQTLVTSSVVSSSYTPGAGNMW
jgi:uncharacterized protein involved in type VI secretion and phage assembly